VSIEVELWRSEGIRQIVRFDLPMLGISRPFHCDSQSRATAGRPYEAASKRISVAFAPEEFHFDRAAAMKNPG